MTPNVRALAAKCIFAVIDKGRSLADELPVAAAKAGDKDSGLLQELVYGVLRHLPELEYSVSKLMQKPLKGKQRVFHHLLLVGIYQLKYLRVPDHAAVAETVAATTALKNKHLKGLINGVLRNYLREPLNDTSQLADPIKFNHPGWFIKKVQAAYPDTWQSIFEENQLKPPMWIRVNQQKTTIDEYKRLLSHAKIDIAFYDEHTQAIRLAKAVDVSKLPNFDLGWVSIQDGAAQYSALYLEAQKGDSVLDCCAAPGGKTCHILEMAPGIEQMLAIDIDQSRLDRVQENLTRLGLYAKLMATDAAQVDQQLDTQRFDRILLDAPCSGTGVIRRHPDIKWLRKASDIDVLVELQQQILSSVWQLLSPGGTLVYATCSVLPEENKEQVQRFVKENSDAKLVSISQSDETAVGRQILPGQDGMDGFYYAKLTKLQ